MQIEQDNPPSRFYAHKMLLGALALGAVSSVLSNKNKEASGSGETYKKAPTTSIAHNLFNTSTRDLISNAKSGAETSNYIFLLSHKSAENPNAFIEIYLKPGAKQDKFRGLYCKLSEGGGLEGSQEMLERALAELKREKSDVRVEQ